MQTVGMTIRRACKNDLNAIHALYQLVADHPGGLARTREEVDRDYVETFMQRSQERGLQLVFEGADDSLLAEIHAYSPGNYCFSHLLSELTLVVDSSAQGAGLGRRLFTAFLDRVKADMRWIRRVELVARESNQRAIGLYESLGFEREGRLAGRILNPDRSVEADIPMALLIPDGDAKRMT